ncbi:MAG: hypothetical protein Ct9H300mP8_03830 [Gammaproteobacteria bacterium]|nr:MAG: hypothetical protein Ct9H300mP8_03830 [Gammaproteobacteria bacterium]
MAESAEHSASFPFVKMEHEILSLWEEERVFEKSLEFTKDKKPYIFYDGPPFATGCRTTEIYWLPSSRTLCRATGP